MDNFQLSELAQKAKNGDMAAFEKLYIELSPEIYAIACEITQNKEESHDLVQDCFVAALENISTLNEPDKIKNWLIRIAANKSRDYLKKKKPSVLTEDQYEIIDNLEEDDIAVIPEASLETEERIEDVNEILACLTEEKRLCLLLRYKYDMSYAEIANELGITESAVKSRISRAKDDIEKEAEKREKKGLPLFGIAPFGLVIFALNRSADITASAFAGSAAQTAAFASVTATASQAGFAAASTAATATTASAAGTTATAATGIGAKVAAMSVAQKVVAGITAATIATGSATVTTVVVKNKIEGKESTTTAYVEEVTTAPDYGFESETVFIPAVAETETATELSTSNKSTSTVKQSTTVTQVKETEKSTVANKTTTKSTTKANTTTQKQTTTTTKSETTKKETTTEEVTTTPTTTKTVTTTKAVTTTKEVTTTKAETTTTTKATTTTTTTESASPATVTVKVYSAGSGSEYKTYNLTFDSGVTLSDSDIESGLMSQHGIDAMADSFSVTTEPGGSYTATAYEI
ncbi:MAG: sigma-70 family RNA polymerase sigma factor [Clostridia bacterium]|nr:sigma-70 family RNA polymerase sigma factor [Clostridia bacterium]